MATTEITLDEWTKVTRSRRADRKRWNGKSPGGVAAEFGITRQSVHQAIHRGDLDAVRILDDEGRLRAILVTEDSMDRYRALRELRETV